LPDDVSDISVSDPSRYSFANAYQEACGLTVKHRTAKQLGHRDAYEKLFRSMMEEASKELAERYMHRETVDPSIIRMALAYHMTEMTNRLDIGSFRNWVRRNPLEINKQEVDHIYNVFHNSVQQHF
jgi:hypothetical protein